VITAQQNHILARFEPSLGVLYHAFANIKEDLGVRAQLDIRDSGCGIVSSISINIMHA